MVKIVYCTLSFGLSFMPASVLTMKIWNPGTRYSDILFHCKKDMILQFKKNGYGVHRLQSDNIHLTSSISWIGVNTLISSVIRSLLV